MDPRIASQRKGGIVILVVFVLAIGIAAGILLATGLDWVPYTNARETSSTRPGEAASVEPDEFLVSSQESFRDLVAAVRPAVVSIQAQDFDKNMMEQFDPGDMQFDPFEMFGLPNPDGKGMPHQGPENFQDYFPAVSSGSGFIVSPDGYLLTNNHVVDGANDVRVILDNGDEYDAEMIGNDPDTDVAVLKINRDEPFAYLDFGNAEAIEVGDWVMAVGNPFGNLAGTVTVGIVSATGREYLQLPGDTYYQNFIQTDAAINFGNSGGPLVDITGKVVGINTAISSQGSGIGFATPVDLVEFVYDSFLEHGEVLRGWIGVTIHNLDNDLANALGLETHEGTIVAGVTEGHPAAEGGLMEGDVILEVEGEKINSTATASRLIAELPIGEAAEFKVWRDGEMIKLEITPARRAPDEFAMYDENWYEEPVEDDKKPSSEEFLGLSVRELETEDLEHYDLDAGTEGVIIENVQPRTTAFEKGLRVGNVIVEINNQPVTDLDDYMALMGDAKEQWDSDESTVIIRYLGYGEMTGWVRSFMAIPFE